MNLDLAARDGVILLGVVLLGVVGLRSGSMVFSKISVFDLLWSSF